MNFRTPRAFYVVAYGSLSVPAILAGVLVTHISLQSTFENLRERRRRHRPGRRVRSLASEAGFPPAFHGAEEGTA
jgi:hypothetical protein